MTKIKNCEPEMPGTEECKNNRRFISISKQIHTMENTELKKLANAITFGGNRGKVKFIEDVTFFMKQVKQKATARFNGVSEVLVFQGKQGVGKSTLAKKISDNYPFAHAKGAYTGLFEAYSTDYSVIEFSEVKLTKGEIEKVVYQSTLVSVPRRIPYTEEVGQYAVISSIICTSQKTKQLEEGRRLKPFIIEKIDFEALNAVDFGKIYQSI